MSLSRRDRHQRRRRVRIPLLALEAFVAIGAVYGSVMLVTDAWQLDPDLLRRLPVDTWVLPGIALALLVAVPNLAAGALVAIGHPRARVASLLAGGILVGWIVVQIALIRQYFYLQPVMAVCGLLTIVLAYLLPEPTRPHGRDGLEHRRRPGVGGPAAGSTGIRPDHAGRWALGHQRRVDDRRGGSTDR